MLLENGAKADGEWKVVYEIASAQANCGYDFDLEVYPVVDL